MPFNHSVKVPTQYKRLAHILKTALEGKKSLKSLMFEEKHVRMRGVQAILKQYIDNRPNIDDAIVKTKILEENPRLCPALCKILVTELLFGRKQLIGESKPVTTVINYRDRLVEALGGEAEIRTKDNKKDPKPRYVRINRNYLTVPEAIAMVEALEFRKKELSPQASYEDFLNAIRELEEDEFIMDMHVFDLLIFHPKQRYFWATHDYVKDMKFLLQDKGTCCVAELLSPPPGAVLLDMCAAPGMKTIHCCNMMKNQGKIYAVEQSDDRFTVLSDMVHKAGCEIVETFKADSLTIDDELFPGVEYILLDPPCSGSGMQSRLSLNPDSKDARRLYKLAGLQIKFLNRAMTAFPDVKRIIYSTCSLHEEENEQVIERCLETHPDFKLLSCKKEMRIQGLKSGNSKYKNIGKNCLYTRPDDLADGIFIALLERRRMGTED